MTNFPVLYSRTVTGAIQQWEVVVENNTFYTVEGQVDGVLTQSSPTVCHGKNSGKRNETSDEEQALKEAKSRWQKKIDRGYFEDIKDIDIKIFTEPMLAKKYEDVFKPSMFPVWVNYKYDGMRCVVRADGMWSRYGKEIKSAPHIRRLLQPVFDKNPDAIIDGELYCHKLNKDFNKIISLAKKTKPTKSDLDESAEVLQYYIYDYASYGDLVFSKRLEKLREDIPSCKCLVVVPNELVHNQEELDEHYGRCMEEGYEGQIIRLDKPYEFKRSKFLLKRKEFIDCEYQIIDVVEGVGNRSGMVGYCVMKMEDGRTFKSNVKGNFDYLKEFLDNRKELIGKDATVKFFNYTPDGIPRFPYIIAVRDYE